jgi:hypothetical protein
MTMMIMISITTMVMTTGSVTSPAPGESPPSGCCTGAGVGLVSAGGAAVLVGAGSAGVGGGVGAAVGAPQGALPHIFTQVMRVRSECVHEAPSTTHKLVSLSTY